MNALEDEYATLRRAAFNALARRDHSVSELKEKLLKRSDNVAAIDKVLQTLIDNRFLDDARLTELLTQAKYRQGLGPYRIIRMLRTKGLSSDAVQNVFTEHEWRESLAMTWGKRFTEKPQDKKSYLQQARYLQYRGFTLEQINLFLREQHHEE